MKGRTKIPVPQGVCPEEIVRLIGYDIRELRSADTSRILADRRRVVAKVLTWLGLTTSCVGEVLNRDHSSVSAMLKTSHLVENETERIIAQLIELGYGKETKK